MKKLIPESLAMCTTCDRRKKSPRGSSNLYLILLAIACLTLKVTANSIPKSNSISHLMLNGPVEDSLDLDSEEEDEDEMESVTPSRSEVRLHYAIQSSNYTRSTPKTAHTPHTTDPTTTIEPQTCAGSCLDRQTRENAALKSFKDILLKKLGMEHMPNVTKAHKLPDWMLEQMCIGMKMPPEYCTGKASRKGDNNYEYQSDGTGAWDEEPDVIEDHEDVQFMSSESRIYAFPSSEF
jgi:hypothetical protein